MVPGFALMYFFILFLICPRTAITSVVVFIPHIGSISISRPFYIDKFLCTFTEAFLSVGMDMSMSEVHFSFSFMITISGLLAFISRSVCIEMSHRIVV